MIDARAIIHRRLVAQRLAADPLAAPGDVVGWLGAMQAQEYAEAKWSIGQRMRDGTDAGVEGALDRGEILRIHVLRPTWHFVAPADLRWLLALTAPRVQAANRYWNRKFELDETLLARSLDVISKAFAGGGALSRAELAETLRRSGIEAEGPSLAYILMNAELEALICSGPRHGRQHSYALVADRCPPQKPFDRSEALAELIRRFFTSRGPATVNDFTTWSSLTVADAIAGIEAVAGELEREVDEAGTTWFATRMSAGKGAASAAFLIPMYDEMVMGYKHLKVVLAAPPPRDGLLQRPIVIDGLTVGSWKRILSSRSVLVEATLFRALENHEAASLQAAVDRFGRFNDRAGLLEIVG